MCCYDHYDQIQCCQSCYFLNEQACSQSSQILDPSTLELFLCKNIHWHGYIAEKRGYSDYIFCSYLIHTSFLSFLISSIVIYGFGSLLFLSFFFFLLLLLLYSLLDSANKKVFWAFLGMSSTTVYNTAPRSEAVFYLKSVYTSDFRLWGSESVFYLKSVYTSDFRLQGSEAVFI